MNHVCLLALFGLLLLVSPFAFADACLPQILTIQSAKAQGQEPLSPGSSTLIWQDVTLPDQWIGRWPGYSGAVWYRIDWRRSCPTNLKYLHAPAEPVALGVHSMVMAGEVFVNGDLLWRDRHLAEPLSRSWNMPRFWLLPESILNEDSNSVWIRVHGIAEQTPGLGEVRLDEPETLRQWHEKAWWNQRTLLR